RSCRSATARSAASIRRGPSGDARIRTRSSGWGGGPGAGGAGARRSPAAGGGAPARGGFGAADPGRGRPHGRDLSVRGPARVLGGRLPRRERERGGELQSPVPEGQPSDAAPAQPGGQRRGEIERDDLRDPLSPLCAAARAPPNDRRDCPPAVPPDLEDPASGRPVRGTRPSPEPKVQATPGGQNYPRTPKLRLSGRTGQRPVDGCSRVATGIFDPESVAPSQSTVFGCASPSATYGYLRRPTPVS